MDTETTPRPRPAMALFAALTLPVLAAGPRPEIVRATGAPQVAGAVHTVRGIPEACTRLEGLFTGRPDRPYRLTAVRTDPACRPRARFVDFARVQPAPAEGWRLNDLIRVPSAACPSLHAVVRVWRRPGATPPPPGAQGGVRVYLQEAGRQAVRDPSVVSMYAAELVLEGRHCGR